MKPIFTSILILLLTHLSAQNRFHVHTTATGAGNGVSWADAFTDLQAALQTAQAGDEVWVAEGTYFPTNTADRNISFEPVSGLKIYGGFAGNETLLSQRDWASHPTVLSGDIGILGDSSDNAYNVVYLLEPDSSTLLDGFVVRDGAATNSGALPSRDRRRCGGGLYIMAEGGDAYPDIKNCVFLRNTARAFGAGAMANGGSDGSVAPRFINCRFEDNHALASGGGVGRFGGSWVERGNDLEGCVFLRNRAGFRGGGFYYVDTERNDTLDIYGCTFQENRAVDDGGGAYLGIGRLNPSGFTIKTTSFIGNLADNGAAFITYPTNFLNANYLEIDSCEFVSNVFVSNNSTQTAVAFVEILGATGSKGQFKNCLFQSNKEWSDVFLTEWNDAEGIFDRIRVKNNKSTNSLFILGFSEKTIISNSTFSNNSFGAQICLNVVAKNSFYTNCIFDGNKSGAPGEYISFERDTLILQNCTFVNNEAGQVGNYPNTQAAKLAQNCLLLGINNKSRFLNTQNYAEYAHCYFDTIDCALLGPYVYCGPNNLVGLDPLFRDTANHDYSLLPCSPLLNKGSNAAASGILTDIAGNPRIQEGIVDIGAYESPAFALASAPAVLPACASDSNGSISVNPVFGCEPYDYQWLPPAGNGPELNGLPPGQYLLSITDASGRQILDTITVGQAPAPSLSLASSDVQCGGQAGGSLLASVASGTAPFQYQWSPAAPDTAQLSQLQPGSYALTLTDANGCQDSATASIALLGMLQPMIGGETISCNGAADGWLSLTPATGAPPFTWLWDGWPGSDSIAQPLGPGNYSVTVTDAFGCTASNTFPTMTDPAPITATVGTTDQTDLVMPNGAAVVTTVSGGTPSQPPAAPYAFSWSNGGMGQFIAGLMAGEYTVTVTDQNGCTASVTVEVDLMVGTEEAEGQALLIYPNPTADWVQVVLPARQGLAGGPKNMGTARLELSDASGRVLRSAEASEGVFDLRGLPSGGYVLRVRDVVGKVLFVGKVVKR